MDGFGNEAVFPGISTVRYAGVLEHGSFGDDNDTCGELGQPCKCRSLKDRHIHRQIHSTWTAADHEM